MSKTYTQKSAVDLVKHHFLDSFDKKNYPGYQYLDRHVGEVERWAKKILAQHPEANAEIVLMGVWLHDIGQTGGDKTADHAIYSEKEAMRFLQELNVDKSIIDQVAHCVRAHRNRDVKPETLEAKIVAASDSASHMTDINYIVHLSDGMKNYIEGKIERDYCDISIFPELKKELTPLFHAWKELIRVFPVTDKTDLQFP